MTFASQLFDYQARVSEMSLCTLLPSTHGIDAPFKEIIKSLARVVGVSLPMTLDEGF